MEYINIVNEKNHMTSHIKEKNKAHVDGDFHRTVLIWIINKQNEVLLQKRSATKKNHPNEWDVSSARTCASRRNYIRGS